MAGLAMVYLLAVGVSAHSLDALAPNKPWGEFLTRRQLTLMAIVGLVPALLLGLYYAFTFAPLLIPIGIAELFFLFSYNIELFEGRFHTDIWFAFSWGFLPVLAGFVVQTNTLSIVSLAGGLFGFATAFVEINASRPYRELKRDPSKSGLLMAARLEAILKGTVASVLAATLFLLLRSFLA
jgi:4-hydroxybenzoate polyprenyltransferase